MRGIAVALIGLSLAAVVPAMAQESYRGKVGKWEIGSSSERAPTRYCYASAENGTGQKIIINVIASHKLALTLYDRRWGYVPATSVNLRFSVDRRPLVALSADVVTPQSLIVPLDPDTGLVDQIRTGATLTVGLPDGQFYVDLTDAHRAIDEATRCLGAGRQMARPQPPAHEPAPTSEEHPIRFGNWAGGAYRGDQGQFAYCAVGAMQGADQALLFQVTKDYAFSLSVADRRWRLTEGRSIPIRLSVDGSPAIDRTATVIATGQVLVTIDDRITFFDLVRRGYRLTIESAAGRASYDLTGSFGALTEVLRCVGRYANDDPRPQSGMDPSSPFDRPRTDPSPRDPVHFDREAALNIVANILTEAGQSGFRFVDIPAFRAQNYSVTWRYAGGQLGAFGAVRRTPPDLLEKHSADLVAAGAAACAGQFASGIRETERAGAWSGRRLFTYCRKTKSGTGVVMHYSLGRFEDGSAMVAGTVVSFDSALDGDLSREGADIDAAIFRTSAFRTPPTDP
jgi:hypothetical protein